MRSAVPAQAFDELAPDYDATFTAGVLGRHLRAAVWRRLDARFAAGDRVLELGCGTGEDAVYLARSGLEVVALDRSAGMLEAARRKVARAGVGGRVDLRPAAVEEWSARPAAFGGPFDGALSNFGALNCVDDLAPVATALAASLRPGAWAVLVIMGPLVPWEWLWYLARGRPAKAFRRLRRGGVAWRGLRVYYPAIRTVRKAFRETFDLRRSSAVGVLLPPSYVERWAARRPRWVDWLDRVERRIEAWPPLPWLADHYLVELERR